MKINVICTIRDRFRDLLKQPGHDNPEAHTSQKLKSGLKLPSSHNQGHLIVYAPITNTLHEAAKLTKLMNDFDEFQDIVSKDRMVMSEDSIVHQVVGIIRRRVL